MPTDLKPSAATPASALTGPELVPCTQGGASVVLTPAQLAAYIASVVLPLLTVDNVKVDGNTISSTNANGAVNLAPNGAGQVTIPDGSMGAPALVLASAPTGAGIGKTPAGFGLMHNATIYTDLRTNALALRGGAATPGLQTSNPGLLPDFTDGDTGVGSAGANQLSLFAGNIEGVRVTSAGSVFGGGSNFKGFTTTAGAPTVTEYPANKDWGFHLNTGTGAVSIAYNLSGAIKTAALI